MTGQPLIFPTPTADRTDCDLQMADAPRLSLPQPQPRLRALAPQCLNRGFAATHTPFIPPKPSRCNPWLAALAAKNIRAHLDTDREYPIIWVPHPQADRAQRELKAYESINENWPSTKTTDQDGDTIFSHDALCLFIILQAALIRFHLELARSGQIDAWEQRGLWNPQAIANGEWWRCVTALTLHQDLAHVTSNAFWGLIFGTLVATRIGTGVTILLMLITGILGNATMLALGGTHHSLGASTMVFGLLGILATIHTRRKWRERERGRGPVRLIPAVPLAFAMAMGAMQGAAPGADALAHACGFAWGLIAGTLGECLRTAKISITVQLTTTLLALAVILAAWWTAWTR